MKLLGVFVALCLSGAALLLWCLTAPQERAGTAADRQAVRPATAEAPWPDRTEPVVAAREVASDGGLCPAEVPDAPDGRRDVGRYDAPLSQPAVTTVPAEAGEDHRPTSTPADPTFPRSHAPTFPPPPTRWADDVRQQSALLRLGAAREVLATDPDHPRALWDKLDALRELQRWPEAGDTLARLIRLEPEDVTLRREYAQVLIRQGRWALAVPTLRELLARVPDDVDSWVCLAAAQQTLGHLGDARRSWTRVLELRPADAEAYLRRGQVQLALRDWQAAVSDFEQALAAQPEDVGAVLDLSQALAALGREEEARARVLEVLERHHRHVPALNRMAELCWQAYMAEPVLALEQLDAAVIWWQRSLAVDANQPAIHSMLETALQQRR